MPIDLTRIRTHAASPQTYSWSDRDFVLYALALGFGRDPTDLKMLPFLYEERLKVVPTMPTVLAWIAEPRFAALGADPVTALHGEQAIVIHRPLTSPLTVRTQGRVVGVYDKGAGRGALIVTEHEITDASDGARLADLTTTCFARSEGGCGNLGPPPPAPDALPDRTPDELVEFVTQPNAALLYRLTGDRNPLHVDPDVARAAGYPRPILHGLCTFGMACRAVLQTYVEFDPSRIVSQQARFSAPVFPGETLCVELWRDADVISFRVRVAERNVIALTNGRCVLRSTAG